MTAAPFISTGGQLAFQLNDFAAAASARFMGVDEQLQVFQQLRLALR